MSQDPFSGRVRVRVCGLLVENGKLLLARLSLPTRKGLSWMPPGGGVETGEKLETALAREWREETGLEISTQELLYIHEFLEPPWHAVEFYFRCIRTGGELNRGSDPELAGDKQILHELRFVDLEDLTSMNLYPEYIRHHFAREIREAPVIRYIHTAGPGPETV